MEHVLKDVKKATIGWIGVPLTIFVVLFELNRQVVLFNYSLLDSIISIFSIIIDLRNRITSLRSRPNI